MLAGIAPSYRHHTNGRSRPRISRSPAAARPRAPRVAPGLRDAIRQSGQLKTRYAGSSAREALSNIDVSGAHAAPGRPVPGGPGSEPGLEGPADREEDRVAVGVVGSSIAVAEAVADLGGHLARSGRSSSCSVTSVRSMSGSSGSSWFVWVAIGEVEADARDGVDLAGQPDAGAGDPHLVAAAGRRCSSGKTRPMSCPRGSG